MATNLISAMSADDIAGHSKGNRRDFLYYMTASTGAIATAAAVWQILDSMNPTADVMAFSKVEIDLADVALGARITVKWKGKPVFIDHRTESRISAARADDDNPALIDPETDAERVQRPEWLVQIGVCTHLGCIPLGQADSDARGEWDGWFCPCHGSVYDSSGRIRRGPAPRNLDVPPYNFATDTLLRIG